MENTTIHLSEALNIMQFKDRNGDRFPFDLTYRTFNSQSSQGGKLLFYTKVKYLPEANKEQPESTSSMAIFSEKKAEKTPMHFKNRTRNIELESGEIKKIRIDFIISINNKKVIY